jgi:hypothetical protein
VYHTLDLLVGHAIKVEATFWCFPSHFNATPGRQLVYKWLILPEIPKIRNVQEPTQGSGIMIYPVTDTREIKRCPANSCLAGMNLVSDPSGGSVEIRYSCVGYEMDPKQEAFDVEEDMDHLIMRTWHWGECYLSKQKAQQSRSVGCRKRPNVWNCFGAVRSRG